ncbi:MAG: GNAT family N-acetyltransferase [Planctomycetota bacterium]
MNPMTINIPERLETDRLVLRLPTLADAEIVAAGVQASIEELHEWMPWAKKDYGVDDATTWIHQTLAEWHQRKGVPYLILLDGVHVGNVGLFDVEWDVPRGEIGYWMRTDHVGKGYMTEACNVVTDLAMETFGFHRIIVTSSDNNVRSWAVAERCGYTFEGVLRNYRRHTDGTLDHARMYAKTSA